MKYSLWVAGFFRCVALVLVVTVTTVSCSFPFGSAPISGGGVTPSPVIKPGEGDVRYVYLDDDGNISDTDIGITGLFIENNANAAGTVIISLDTGIQGADKIVVVKNEKDKITVSMSFKDGEAFPYQMIATQGQDTWRGFLSRYRENDSTYDITFQQGDSVDTYPNLVLNKDIFSLYQDNTDLTASQNIRIKNVTVALGLWGSLAASMTESPETGGGRFVAGIHRGIFSSIFKRVAKIFTAVSVIATVVAYVVAPIVTFISPVAGLAIQQVAKTVAIASAAVAAAFASFAEPEAEPYVQPPPFTEAPFIIVTNIYENRQITNGEEFHIGLGSDALFNFWWPGLDNTTVGPIEKMQERNSQMEDDSTNEIFFKPILEKDPNRGTDAYQVRIKRGLESGSFLDGKIAFGFHGFKDSTLINGSSEGVMFKRLQDAEETMHRGMVVIRFCIDKECPEYVD